MKFTKITLLSILVLAGSFLSAGPVSAQDAVLQQLETLLHNSPETFDSFSPEQIQQLYNLARYNLIANPDTLDSSPYDPQGIIGYCFGRALTVQLIARQMGLKDASLEKLFIIGPMKEQGDGPVAWRFHVTTVVKGGDGRRWAIDPIFPHPMPIDEWAKTVRSIYDSWNSDPNPLVHTKLYLTSPLAVMPDTRIFKTDDQEKGDRIIEVKFDPTNPDNIKTGFKAETVGGVLFYDVDDATTQQYWLHLDTSPGARRDTLFNLNSITINGTLISFHNYFVDLLNNLVSHPPGTVKSEAQARALEVPNSDSEGGGATDMMKAGCDNLMKNLSLPNAPLSFRFDRILAGPK